MSDDMEFRLIDPVRLEFILKKCRNPVLRHKRKRECQDKQINLKEHK